MLMTPIREQSGSCPKCHLFSAAPMTEEVDVGVGIQGFHVGMDCQFCGAIGLCYDCGAYDCQPHWESCRKFQRIRAGEEPPQCIVLGRTNVAAEARLRTREALEAALEQGNPANVGWRFLDRMHRATGLQLADKLAAVLEARHHPERVRSRWRRVFNVGLGHEYRVMKLDAEWELLGPAYFTAVKDELHGAPWKDYSTVRLNPPAIAEYRTLPVVVLR